MRREWRLTNVIQRELFGKADDADDEDAGNWMPSATNIGGRKLGYREIKRKMSSFSRKADG